MFPEKILAVAWLFVLLFRLMYVKAFHTNFVKGDTCLRELFEEEYKKIDKSLYLVAVGYLRNTEDAKDAVSEAVISAYQSFHKLKHKEYFKTWITRIVINKCKDFLKMQRYTEQLDDAINVFYTMPTDDIEIMDAICRLDSQYTPYITLRFYNDMTYDEMAKTLNQPVSTVKYKTKIALDELKKLLGGDDYCDWIWKEIGAA